MKIKLSEIKTKSPRVRQSQDPEKLDELAASLSAFGVAIVPVGVRKNGAGWDLIYGHRRVAAAKQAGLKEIDAIEVEAADDMLKVFGLVENVVREDMNSLDIAKALQQIKDESGWSDEKVGKFFGHEKAWVNHHLQLLEPEVVKAIGKSMPGDTFGEKHLREVKTGLGADKSQMPAVIRKVVEEGLSTRQARALAESVGVASKAGDKSRAKEILSKAKSTHVADPKDERDYQEARTRIIERQKVKRPIAWETVPEVARLLKTIRAWKGVVPEFDVAISIGKLSPEGRRFAAEKIKELVREVRNFLKTIEELQKKLEA